MLNNNDLFEFNNIVFNIYNTEDFDDMRRELIEAIQRMIPCKCITAFRACHKDPAILSDPIALPTSFTAVEASFGQLSDKNYAKWVVQKRVPTVVRASEMIPDEEREKLDYYQHFYAPHGIHHSMILTIAMHNDLCGAVFLYRAKEEPDFDADDARILSLLGEHLNIRFYQEKHKHLTPTEPASVPSHNQRFIRDYGLTIKEAEIAALLMEDMSTAEICDRQYISMNTLKKHLQNIYRKTGVSRRADLVRKLSL